MQYTLKFSSDRILQRIAYDIYRNDQYDHVLDLMQLRYSNETWLSYRDYINPVKNPLKRTAEAQSVLYTRPPRLVTAPDQSVAEQIRAYTPDLYPALEAAQVMCCAITDAFIWPYWSDTYKQVKLQLVAPHLVDVHLDKSDLLAVKIETGRNECRVFTRDAWWDTAGTRPGEQWWEPASAVNIQPLGEIPIVWFRLKPFASQTWGIRENLDLITGTLEIGLEEALHNRTAFLRSFRQLTANADQVADGVTSKQLGGDIGPGSITPYQIDSKELADPSDEFAKSIRDREIDLASSRGISSKSYFREQVTADELVSATEELKRRWVQQQKIFSNPEKQLSRIIGKIIENNTKEISSADSQTYRIDYVEPSVLTDRKLALGNLAQGISLGVDNIVDFLYRNDPEYQNIEEVEAKIDQNIAYRMRFQIEPYREGNLPADPTQQNLTPEENGAKAQDHPSAADPERNGSSGPPVVPPVMDARSQTYKPGTAQSAIP